MPHMPQMKNLLAASLLLLLLFSNNQNSQAAEESLSNDLNQEICLLQEQLARLENLKKSDISKEEKVVTEEKLKKELVISLFDCGLSEVGFLKSKLSELSLPDQGVEVIRQELIEKLNVLAEYYIKQKEEIKASGPTDIKTIAKSLKKWREENYNPLQQKITSFVLWVNNQALFDAAKNRFDKLNQIVKTLKIIDQDEDKIQGLIQRASDILKTAQTNNFLAKQALKNSNLAEDAFIFIRASLSNLHQVYQVFFELGDAIRHLLLR